MDLSKVIRIVDYKSVDSIKESIEGMFGDKFYGFTDASIPHGYMDIRQLGVTRHNYLSEVKKLLDDIGVDAVYMDNYFGIIPLVLVKVGNSEYTDSLKYAMEDKWQGDKGTFTIKITFSRFMLCYGNYWSNIAKLYNKILQFKLVSDNEVTYTII